MARCWSATTFSGLFDTFAPPSPNSTRRLGQVIVRAAKDYAKRRARGSIPKINTQQPTNQRSCRPPCDPSLDDCALEELKGARVAGPLTIRVCKSVWLKSKIHRATITDGISEVRGSLTIAADLMEKCGLIAYVLAHWQAHDGEDVTCFPWKAAAPFGTICPNRDRRGWRRSQSDFRLPYCSPQMPLVSYEPAFLHQVGRDGQAAFVLQIAICDCGAVNLRF